MKNIPIKDPSDPRLAPYRSLKGKSLEREGIFIAEGEKVVRCLVNSSIKIASCLISKEAVARHKALLAVMAKRKVPLFIAKNELIGSIIGFRFHKGIMAAGHCPKKWTLDDILKKAGRPLLLIALNGVNDPQNVGLIARSAAAFGASALIVDNASYDPYYRKAVRVSMGTIFGLPVYYESDLASSLRELKKKYATRIIAATPGIGAIDISEAALSGNICFVFGNEDKGVARGVLSAADERVRIPISKSVDSLNVASACAVCLYESLRQRDKKMRPS